MYIYVYIYENAPMKFCKELQAFVFMNKFSALETNKCYDKRFVH